ncbi:MAG: endonuclease III [Defluviitaleaceae bacterium]|nr:endonuclease III [Defluviitaleaceae bacterium]
MKAKVSRILKTLDRLYPFDGVCFLNYEQPWQLLFATILSAQCTDARVNQVTASLFADFPSLAAFACAEISLLEKAVHSTGFFRAKARHLQASARKLLSEHNGELPSDIESLTALSGVGRKTANVVRGHIFKIPSIVVDTHVKRVSNRLGLANHSDPEKIEFELMEILPKTYWIQYNQQIITHGRQICASRSPRCGECRLQKDCKFENLLANFCTNRFVTPIKEA